jgi:hypothetical protein
LPMCICCGAVSSLVKGGKRSREVGMSSAARMTQINALPRALCEEWPGRRGRAMAPTGTSRTGLTASLRAGVLYFAVVFALGLAFALVRDGLLHLGAAEATRLRAALVEIPVLLVAACQRRRRRGRRGHPRSTGPCGARRSGRARDAGPDRGRAGGRRGGRPEARGDAADLRRSKATLGMSSPSPMDH